MNESLDNLFTESFLALKEVVSHFGLKPTRHFGTFTVKGSAPIRWAFFTGDEGGIFFVDVNDISANDLSLMVEETIRQEGISKNPISPPLMTVSF